MRFHFMASLPIFTQGSGYSSCSAVYITLCSRDHHRMAGAMSIVSTITSSQHSGLFYTGVITWKLIRLNIEVVKPM